MLRLRPKHLPWGSLVLGVGLDAVVPARPAREVNRVLQEVLLGHGRSVDHSERGVLDGATQRPPHLQIHDVIFSLYPSWVSILTSAYGSIIGSRGATGKSSKDAMLRHFLPGQAVAANCFPLQCGYTPCLQGVRRISKCFAEEQLESYWTDRHAIGHRLHLNLNLLKHKL